MKNKGTIAIVIAISLMISAGTLQLLPQTFAHSPAWQIPTYAYLNVAPNPAGLGQTVSVNFWLAAVPPTANGVYGDRWTNFTVTVTKPDGTTQTLGPFKSDDTGGSYTAFTPDQLGNYTFVFNFGGQTLAGANLAPGQTSPYIGDYYQPSTSNKVTLLVQQESVPTIPQTPLPTSYWTRPVQSVNGLWSDITGNWLGLGAFSFANTGGYNASGNYNPYSLAPTTSHILWTKPAAFGGLIGGEFGGSDTAAYYSTANYEPKYAPIIMNGILYYEQYPGASTNPAGWIAVNLRTGQTLWTFNSTQVLRTGQLLNFVTPNQYGAFGYLWSTGAPPSGLYGISATAYSATGATYTTTPYNNGFTGTNYNMYDALTGSFILSIVNGTSMTLTEDQNGNLIGYYVNSSTANAYSAPTLNCWNSTQAILYPNGQPANFSSWLWRPAQNTVIPFSAGIMWSKPIATNISGTPLGTSLGFANAILGPASINSGVVLLTSAGATVYQTGYIIEAGYDANTGAQLWITNRTETPFSRVQLLGIGDGKYVTITLATATATCYSLQTGSQLWSKVLPDAHAYDSIGGYIAVLADNALYAWGFGGDIWSINMADGNILWHTDTNHLLGDSGSDTPYGTWPLWTFTDGSIAGGILFVPVGHEYSPPLFRGAKQLAINITNGELAWSIMGFDVASPPAVADGIMTTLNCYDNQVYAYGKGATKLTVNAPGVGVTTSTPITISGTITDISTGSEQDAVATIYPSGLPAVSDASMEQFMEAVYQQQPMPTNTSGVSIDISVLDSNGNYRTIGATTSNALGTYGFTWTPDIAGDFTIYATFAGSQSYYPSQAATSFHASETAATASPQPTQAPSMADQYVLPGIIGLAIVIVVVGAVIILALRKRP